MAENWMSMAFTFANFSTALTSYREQMSETYRRCLNQMFAETYERLSHDDA